MKNKGRSLLVSLAVFILLLGGMFIKNMLNWPEVQYSDSVMNVPAFTGEPYIVINNNCPEFDRQDYTTNSYEDYSQLDHLGRCGYAIACVGQDLMPTEERESISSVKPSGWVQAQYDIVDGQSLYNRCHLIGFQLTGENANELNLITGTRYMNVEGMLPFENMIADYVKETDYHVLYRVTPIFDGNNLVARGVQLEALSMEDDGEGICFNVYVYNEQPGVVIDYATGNSYLAEVEHVATTSAGEIYFILNTNSQKFHDHDCSQAAGISENNRDVYYGSRNELIALGYEPAGCCKP